MWNQLSHTDMFVHWPGPYAACSRLTVIDHRFVAGHAGQCWANYNFKVFIIPFKNNQVIVLLKKNEASPAPAVLTHAGPPFLLGHNGLYSQTVLEHKFVLKSYLRSFYKDCSIHQCCLIQGLFSQVPTGNRDKRFLHIQLKSLCRSFII